MANKKKQAGKATEKYKKVRSSVPRVSYTNPSNMYTGPTTQRGITFEQGGPVDPAMLEDYYIEEEEAVANPDDPKKLNTKGEKRQIPKAPINPKTKKPITGRESYQYAEEFYGPIRARLEKAYGGRANVFKAIDPKLKETLYYTSTKDNPYYQFFDPSLATDPNEDQSFKYDQQGNVVMGTVTSGKDKGKPLGITRTSIEGRRYVPPMDDKMKELHAKLNELSDEEIRKLAAQRLTNQEGDFVGISNVTMPSNIGFMDKARYGLLFGKDIASGWTYANGGPTDPSGQIVTRATTLPDGSIIPMINLPEINITAESPQTSLSNLMSNPYMQQRQMELQKQGAFNSQNKGTLSNTSDRPWYSGVANIYEQGKRNQAVQALGAGALGTAALYGGYAAAPYVSSALPVINAGLTAPIAGIPGATTANLLGAYGASSAAIHGMKAGQKAYAGAPASEVTREVFEGTMDIVTPGYKTFGPVAKAVWKEVEQPVTDTFYNTGQYYVDSLSTPVKKMGGMTYGSGAMIERADGSYSPRGLWDNIRANRGSGNEPTEEMLEQERKIRAEEKNEYGGMVDMYAEGSYTVRKTDERSGKTHVVIGPDGTKKYFGDPTMGERNKSKLGEKAFRARHAENLKNNPYFKAYADATWEYGGTTGMYDVYGDGDKVNLNLPVKETPAPQTGLGFNNYLNISPDMVLRGGINPMYYGRNFSVGPYATGYAGLQGAGINDYGIRGTYNINDNFSIGTDINPKRINAGLQYKFANGGSTTNNSEAEKEYYKFKEFVETARQAIGTNDKKTLNSLGFDGKPYSKNDLAKDFKTLQDLREKAGLGVMEEAKILFPHVGQQLRGSVNNMLGTTFKQGGITPTPTGDIFDMMGMSYLNQFALGAEVPCDNPPCEGSMENPRLVTAIPEGYTQDPNNPRLYVKKSNIASGTGTGAVSTGGTKTTGTTVKPKPVAPKTGTTGTGTTQRSTGTTNATGKTVTPRSSSTGTFKSQEDYVYMQEPMIPIQMRPTQLITQIEAKPVANITPIPETIPPDKIPPTENPPNKNKTTDAEIWWRNNIRRPLRKLCNKVKDSTGRFVDQCFEFEDGGTVPFDVKAPMYDETEFPQFINPDVYAAGAGIRIKPENRGKFTSWANSRGMGVQEAANKVMANTNEYPTSVVRMANFAKNAAGWKNGMGGYYAMGGGIEDGYEYGDQRAVVSYGGPRYQSMEPGREFINKMGGYYKMGGYPSYAMGGNVPMYGFGDVVKDIGAGAYGVLEGTLDTVTMGATDPLTDMGYEGLQKLGKSEGKELRTQNMIRGFGTAAGAGIGAAVNPASTGTAISQGAKGLGQGISLAAPESETAQVVGQFLPVIGNIAGMFTGSPAAGSAGAAKSAQFAGSSFGKLTKDIAEVGKTYNQFAPLLNMFQQNAIKKNKNGGMTPGYMQNMRTFAQGGMTMGNVEARELLIDPEKPGGGGVPKILTSYSSPNLPSHPKDGSIDDRGTVPLPEGKFIITQAENKRYKTAARSNDKLMADAITNNIQIKRDRKEAQEMEKASNAYNRFMSKYGGAIEKMYACGGKTYGCGGSVKRYVNGGETETGGYLPGTGVLSPEVLSNLSGKYLPSVTGYMGPPALAAQGQPAAPMTANEFVTSLLPSALRPVETPGYNFMDDVNAYVANKEAQIPSVNAVYTPTLDADKSIDNIDDNKKKKKNKTGKEQKIGTNQILGALQMAAPLYNVGRGLFSKVAEVPVGLGMVSTDIEAPRMTDAAGRRAIREQMNLAKYNAGQLGGANVLPTYAALGTAGAKAASDYTERLRNTLAEATYNAAMDRKRLEAANAAQAAQNWQTQEYLRGIKDQLLSTGVGQVGEAAGQMRKENIYGSAMKDFYTNYTYDPATNSWLPRTT